MRPTKCPACESTDIGDKWCRGRQLQYYCRDCNWSAEPRVPEKRPIPTTKTINVNQFFGYVYEGYLINMNMK